MRPPLRLELVEKRFQNTVGTPVNALNGVSIEFDPDDFAVLLGPSGAGKTTLLRIIAGVEKPTSGKIYSGDENITHIHAASRNIGLVLQSPALLPHLNTRENISLPLKLQKLPRQTIQDRCDKVSQELELGFLLNKLPHEISAGEAQRVSLARALVKEPGILLLDEPLANIDAAGKAALRMAIAKVAKDRLTIYVTHDQYEAMALAKTIVLMRQGQIVETGSPRELYEEPKNQFTAEFIGVPKINCWQDQHWNCARPEHVEITKSSDGHSAIVERVEYFGHEQHIYMKFEGRLIVSRIPAHATMHPGQKVSIQFRRIHRFDSSTGRRIENLPPA